MNVKKLLAAAAVAIAPIASAADTITLSQASTGTTGISVPGLFGDPALFDIVRIGGDNMSARNVYAGGFDVVSAEDHRFLAWCMELAEDLKLTFTYDVVETPFAPSVTESLSRLFTGYVDQIDTGVKAAAFQVSIWELISDSDADLTTGAFQLLNNSAVGQQAEDYLAGLSVFDPDYDLRFFAADGSQDLVTGSPSPVPLPAAGWMLLAGVAALACRGRRRSA